MRDEINSGFVGIVSEGTDYTVDLALALASKQSHLRLLPIAGAGAVQNAKDVMFARGVDFAILQTDVLETVARRGPRSQSSEARNNRSVIRARLIAARIRVDGDRGERRCIDRFRADRIERFDKRGGDEDVVDEFLPSLVDA
jgi:hypothetical protein